MPTCWHCKAESPASHYARVVENKVALYGEWDGWRLSGRFLIAPGTAGRIVPARLLGMLWEERQRAVQIRRSPKMNTTNGGNSSSIVLLPQRERFDGQA